MPILLAQLMTRITGHRSAVRLVAIDTRFHGGWEFLDHDIPVHHRAVTVAAIDACPTVARVAEKNEIGQLVDAVRGKRLRIRGQRGQTLDHGAPGLHRAVAGHAFCGSGESGQGAGVRGLVAVLALQLQLGVLLVTEAQRLILGRETRYGNEKATSESE
jgi:hypothetical protein